MPDGTTTQTQPISPDVPLVSDAMRAAVGRELDRRVAFPISRSDIRRWAFAIYHPDLPPRQFWDESAATASAFQGIVAPEDFNPFAWVVAEPLGPPQVLRDPETLLSIEGPELTRRLRGGMTVRYGVRMRPGDVVLSVRALSGYDEREGRLGRMLFTSIQDTWTNQHDEVVKDFELTFIRY